MRSDADDHAPADYLPLADRNDLAASIDRQVIPGLLKSMVESDQRHIINLSTNTVLDYAFPGWFAEQVKAACVDGSRIILQIAAATALNNLRPMQRLVKELESLGCVLSISDFNAERRTCQLLEHIGVSYIKMRPELTFELTANAKLQESIAQIVEAAEPHGIAVIADEVQDTSSLAVLWQSGIKLIAGSFVRESTQVVAQ